MEEIIIRLLCIITKIRIPYDLIILRFYLVVVIIIKNLIYLIFPPFFLINIIFMYFLIRLILVNFFNWNFFNFINNSLFKIKLIEIINILFKHKTLCFYTEIFKNLNSIYYSGLLSEKAISARPFRILIHKKTKK